MTEYNGAECRKLFRDRQDYAAMLRLDGLTYKEIGRQMGGGSSLGFWLVKLAKRRWQIGVKRAKFRLEDTNPQ